MIEQLIRQHGSRGPCACPAQKIRPFSSSDKQHQDIGHKENQRAPQISGSHQDQDMKSRHQCRDTYRHKFCGTVKHGRHKKDKTDLYEFRRLECKTADSNGELSPEAVDTGYKHNPKQNQPQNTVHPWNLRKLPYPVYNKRNNPGYNRRCQHDNKLF